MNPFVKLIIEDIEKKDGITVGIFGGGFKPPTKGHFEVVKKALEQYPEIDKFFVFIGSGVRNGISQTESLLIWEIYQRYLPIKVEVLPVKSPISEAYDYAKENPSHTVYWFLGEREESEEDKQDTAKKTSKVDNYPNIQVEVITGEKEISGTAARQVAKMSPEELSKYLPDELKDEDVEEIYNILSPIVIENVPDVEDDGKAAPYGSGYETVNENATYSSHIDYKSKIKELTQHMLDKGMNIEPLPKVEFVDGDAENAQDFFGKTAYYDPNTQTIVLYTEGRHPKDIVRSYAHEMVHHIQNLEGRLGNITTTNTQEDDNLNDIEKEAYLNGNITFRNWTDSLNESFYLDIPKFNQPKTLQQYLIENINEISLSKENAVDINGDLTGGTFTVGDITYEYSIKNIPNPYKDLGLFYNVQFTPRGEVTSIPKGGKENYIKILSTMHKIIVDFIDKEQPDYIGISSLDNSGGKNYHTVYNRLTDNNLNLIPGYFRKDSNLTFDSPQGKGRFIVLKKKNSLNEIGDTSAKSYDYALSSEEYYRVKYKFTTDSDLDYVVLFDIDDNIADVLFYIENLKSENTVFTVLSNKGELFKVMSTITKIVNEFINTHPDIDTLVISPSKQYEDDDRRFNLYMQYIKNAIDPSKYEVKANSKEIVIFKKDNIQENKQVNYTNPNFNNEWEEAIRYPEFKKMGKEEWIKTANQGKVVSYSSIKDKLGNVDLDFDSLEEPKKQRFLNAFKKGTIEMSIAVKFSDSDYDLVAGNTRLSGLVKNGIDPKIWVVDISNIQEKKVKDPFGLNAYALELARGLEESLNQKYTIYSDMDGVLTDFDTQFEKISDGKLPSQYEKTMGTDKFWKLIHDEGIEFWSDMPWMKDGKQYWEYIKKYNPILLSAPSKSDISRKGKKEWVNKNLPGTKLILASAPDKQKYSDKNKILIDDKPSNIREWRSKGGIGILHISAEDTIKKLKQLGL